MLIIYHANCADGFTAAWVLRMRYPNATFVPAQYGDAPPDVTNRDVIIADFSYPRETMMVLFERARQLLCFDHHKTAQAELKGLSFCVFDMNKSGARLVWDYLWPKNRVPKLVSYTEDRDLWLWNLESSKEISAYIASQAFTFENWDAIHKKLEVHGIDAVAALGAVALSVVDKYVASNMQNACRIVLGGYEVPCINTTFAISELVGELAEGADFAVGWFQKPDGKFIYSLRARGDSKVDVSAIAREHGGGGHHKAAGFTSDFMLPLLIDE